MTDKFEEALINAVFLRQCLYNKRHEDHSRRVKIKHAWADIATEVGKPVEACKTRWRSLKDRFFKIHRELKSDKPSGSGLVEDISWPYFSQLSFLLDFDEPRETNDSLRNENAAIPIGELQVVDEDGVAVAVPVLRSPDCNSPIGSESVQSGSTLSSSSGSTKRRASRQDLINAIEKIGSSINSHHPDEASIIELQTSSNAAFAIFIRNELDKLNELQQDDARFEIMSALRRAKRMNCGSNE